MASLYSLIFYFRLARGRAKAGVRRRTTSLGCRHGAHHNIGGTEGVAADSSGAIYAAEVGPKGGKKYVRRGGE